jgi:ABC-type oligopeptide transport system substrate-binding subunit
LPGYPAALPAPLATQAARTAEARRLLAAAGFGPGRPQSFELLYHTNEEHKNVALAVAAMWQAIGVRVTLRNAERQAVEVAVRNGEFDMARAALFSAYADANGLFGNFSTGHSANVSAYSNPAFDGALGRAETVPSAGADRAALQRDAERQLIADQAFVPLYFMTSRRLVAQRVSGWSDQNLTALRPARYLDVVTAPAR